MIDRDDMTRIAWFDAGGKLPAWFWQAMATAERSARHGDIPVLRVEDGHRRLLVIDAADWDAVRHLLLTAERGAREGIK